MRSFYKDGNERVTRGRERVKSVGNRSSVRILSVVKQAIEKMRRINVIFSFSFLIKVHF